MAGDEFAPAPVAITMGEPAGIGLEITSKAYSHLRQSGGRAFYLIDDPRRLAALGIDSALITTPDQAVEAFKTALPVFDIGLEVAAQAGTPSTQTAPAVLRSIECAVDHAIAGTASAVVTNPIEKDVLMRAGFTFPGHTEYLAHLTDHLPMNDKARGPVMMMAGPGLRTVPVTVHMAVAAAAQSLTTAQIVRVGRVTARALSDDFGIARPRLVVSGLNPHAGEGGHFGDEDARIIAPAVETLREDGIDIRGPLPADTMFHAAARERYDAALCMLHDQALIPVKTLDFDRTVNVTLGLPILRTSPDHGTALDIAGQGIARADSLVSAIALANDLARRRQSAAA